MAGADWPHYQDFINGVKSANPQIQSEIDKFVNSKTSTIPIPVTETKVLWNTQWNTKNKPLNFDNQDADLEYKQKAFNLPSIKTGITNYCGVPKSNVTVDHKGRVFTCLCDGFVPFSTGHVLDFNNFDEVFNSNQALLTQDSIDKREFEFCAVDLCGIKDNSKADRPRISLFIQIDISCNISCPSCRERPMFINDKTILNEQYTWGQRLKQWIALTDKKVQVELAGGDPLASILYVRFIELFAEMPNVIFSIKTNGLLLKKSFYILEKIKDRTTFSISIDAATAETYERVRRGGRLNQLIENLEYHNTLGKKSMANFVIQKENFREIVPFIDFCKQYSLLPGFTVLQDWGTWHNFEEQCVHIPSSPYYKEFNSLLDNPIFKQNNISVKHLR